MMLYPPLSKLVDKVGSRYLLVNVVARRARQISQYVEENEIQLDEKSVSEAINEIYNDKLHITELTEDMDELTVADKPVVADTTEFDAFATESPQFNAIEPFPSIEKLEL